VSYVSHADLGGLSGFGAVIPDARDDPFHADWERQVLALVLAMGATGSWSLDASRAARETLPGYRELDYYSIWLAALEKLLVAHGLVSPAELAAGSSEAPPKALPRTLRAADVARVLAEGTPRERIASEAARFAVGDRVRTRRESLGHHTRLPGYARGKQGVIARVHGVHVFADASARGKGEAPDWLYNVVFEARELWEGTEVHSGTSVAIDAWQSYLEPA
jgi:nitrile hydratase